MTRQRLALWVAIGVGLVLLVVVVIQLSLLLGEVQAQQERQEFVECMARFGFAPDELNGDLAGMANAAESCDR